MKRRGLLRLEGQETAGRGDLTQAVRRLCVLCGAAFGPEKEKSGEDKRARGNLSTTNNDRSCKIPISRRPNTAQGSEEGVGQIMLASAAAAAS